MRATVATHQAASKNPKQISKLSLASQTCGRQSNQQCLPLASQQATHKSQNPFSLLSLYGTKWWIDRSVRT
jgi:hypothetical protein